MPKNVFSHRVSILGLSIASLLTWAIDVMQRCHDRTQRISHLVMGYVRVNDW